MALRIIHVITRLIVGGAQENTVLTCRGLVERGHHVMLVAGPQTGPEGSLWDAAHASGARILLHPHLRREVAPNHDLLETIALIRLFCQERPDVVHTHSSKAGILGRVAAALAGVPAIIHTNHGLPWHDRQYPLVRATYRSLEQIAGRLSDHIICVGNDMIEASAHAHIGTRHRMTLIRSGIDLDAFSFAASQAEEVRRTLGIDPHATIVGTIARLAPQKGPEFFMTVVRNLASRLQNVLFLWVGDGPLRKEMERQAAELRLPIRFTGLVPPDRVPAYLAAMNVVLMTSLWEGLPRVAVQAGLACRPVVAFDAPGVREVIVEGVNGSIVPRGDCIAMAHAVERVLALPNRSQAAQQRLAEEFDWRRMVDRLDRLYQSF